MKNKISKTRGASYWRTHSAEEYNAYKDELLEEVILHMRYPKDFGCRRLTYDEIAVLMSPDKDHVLSKMTFCKDEMKGLAKIKSALSKMGIKKLADVFDTARDREDASPVKTSLRHM